MPTKAAASGESACTLRGQALTSSELNILFSALNNLVAPLDINLQGAAETAGLKANSYKEMYRQLRRKYELGNPNAAATAAALAGGGSNQSVITSTSSSTATPKKTPGTGGGGDGGGGRGRVARPKKMLLTPGTGGGANQGNTLALATPGTPLGNLSFYDMTPETPSKPIKRSAPAVNYPDETPARKKPAARKPPVSAKQQKDVAAAAATAVKAETTDVKADTDAGVTGDSNGNDVDAAMEGTSQAAEAIEDLLAAAAADEGYTTATEGGGADYGEI